MPFNRHSVLRITREGAVKQELIEGQFALENITFSQAHLRFDLARCARLAVENQIAEIGTVF